MAVQNAHVLTFRTRPNLHRRQLPGYPLRLYELGAIVRGEKFPGSPAPLRRVRQGIRLFREHQLHPGMMSTQEVRSTSFEEHLGKTEETEAGGAP